MPRGSTSGRGLHAPWRVSVKPQTRLGASPSLRFPRIGVCQYFCVNELCISTVFCFKKVLTGREREWPVVAISGSTPVSVASIYERYLVAPAREVSAGLHHEGKW